MATVRGTIAGMDRVMKETWKETEKAWAVEMESDRLKSLFHNDPKPYTKLLSSVLQYRWNRQYGQKARAKLQKRAPTTSQVRPSNSPQTSMQRWHGSNSRSWAEARNSLENSLGKRKESQLRRGRPLQRSSSNASKRDGLLPIAFSDLGLHLRKEPSTSTRSSGGETVDSATTSSGRRRSRSFRSGEGLQPLKLPLEEGQQYKLRYGNKYRALEGKPTTSEKISEYIYRGSSRNSAGRVNGLDDEEEL